jgi:hypothetical protein
MRYCLLLLFGLLSAGCGSSVSLKGTAINVSGKVSQGGQALGGIVMTFHPLGDGHPRDLPVQPDGTFQGEIVSGEYAYYVAKPTTPAALKVIQKVPPQYLQADLQRTIIFAAGDPVSLALD